MKAENILYDIFLFIFYICKSLTFIKFSDKILEMKEIKDKKTDKIIKISASVVFIIFSCFLSMYLGPLRFFVKYISFVLACILYLKCFYITSFIESSVISLIYFLMFYFIYTNCGVLEDVINIFLKYLINTSGIWWDIVLTTIISLTVVYFVITKFVIKYTDFKEYKLSNKEYSLLLFFCLADFIRYLFGCYQYNLWILVVDYISVIAIIAIFYNMKLIKSQEEEKKLLIKHNLVLSKQDQILKDNEKEKYERYKVSVQADGRIRKIRNDLLKHFDYLLDCGSDIKKIRDYIFKIKNEIDESSSYFYTGNSILDLILEEKCKLAEKLDIKFKVMGDFSSGLILEPRSISIIFGNLLDNAIEEAGEVPEGRYKLINITFYQDFVDGLKIILTNSAITEDFMIIDGKIRNIKNKEAHKMRFNLVREEIDDYNGSMYLSIEEIDMFRVEINIPVNINNYI